MYIPIPDCELVALPEGWHIDSNPPGIDLDQIYTAHEGAHSFWEMLLTVEPEEPALPCLTLDLNDTWGPRDCRLAVMIVGAASMVASFLRGHGASAFLYLCREEKGDWQVADRMLEVQEYSLAGWLDKDRLIVESRARIMLYAGLVTVNNWLVSV